VAVNPQSRLILSRLAIVGALSRMQSLRMLAIVRTSALVGTSMQLTPVILARLSFARPRFSVVEISYVSLAYYGWGPHRMVPDCMVPDCIVQRRNELPPAVPQPGCRCAICVFIILRGRRIHSPPIAASKRALSAHSPGYLRYIRVWLLSPWFL